MSTIPVSVAPKPSFPALNKYGNYDQGHLPKHGLHRIPMDGTVRLVRKLGIPVAEIKQNDQPWNEYSRFWSTVGYVIPIKHKRRLLRHIEKQTTRRVEKKAPKPHPDLILCIREASRAAHRQRDIAVEAYSRRQHTLAGAASERKREWYSLKDRGIVAAHKRGLLRYAGASPQGMTVYEFGDGGMSCFHCTLHPVGVERTPIEGHPETLFVAAKEKQKGISEERVRVTLEALPDDDTTDYERSENPSMRRRSITCYNCGGEGHIARFCPEDEPDYSDSFLEDED